MPLPKPKKGEKREDFIARCMTSEAAKEFATSDANGKNQRLAVCESQFDEKDKKKSEFGGVPQQFEGTFAITELLTRAGGADAAAATDIPDGCCARMTGVALTYGVLDDYGTMFAPGCLAQTVGEKVRQGKVRLFTDHEARTHSHVGTVVDIKDIGDTAVMTAVIFDTEAGRELKEYLEAVTKSGKTTGGKTGLSVGFRSREDERIDDVEGGSPWGTTLFKEIELREISVTPVNAVPGTDVMSVRREAAALPEKPEALLPRILARILAQVPESEARAIYTKAYASAADPANTVAEPTGATPAADPAADVARGSESSAESADSQVVPLEERMKIVRETMGTTAVPVAM